ncbi:hypothetical protein BHE90_015089 [Fusarium euwallaceae]|uniref:N-acetyltransferase domain-containing protein n=1 Tax=Fusarium euwallaceae TaxID=1147111 RepID=A0A430L475_9HYPO|nr:hypothetical protein BHE90_015089 [Fusarium euwallaceae]
MAISILPVAGPDLPMLAEFKPLYRHAVESSFNNDTTQCLKAVDEESNELVGYLVLTPKTPVEARKDTEIGSDVEEQGVPEGMHAGVWSAVNNAAAEIKRETDSLDHLEVTYIYVKPSHRQKGIASLLL